MLRAFDTVRRVTFLYDHGTVLVRDQPGSEMPDLFAGARHRALAAGWNCAARVGRGEQRSRTIQ